MSEDTEQQRGEIRKIYRSIFNIGLINIGYLITCGSFLAFLAFLFAVGIVALTNTGLDGEHGNTICTVSLIMSGALFIWVSAGNRIVVRENGLEIHHSFRGSSTFITWDELSHIEVEVDDVGAGEVGGGVWYMLHLKHPIANLESFEIGTIVHMDCRRYSTGGWSSFNYYWVIDPDRFVHSSFGGDLLKYAPHVIEAAQREKERVEAIVAQGNSRDKK